MITGWEDFSQSLEAAYGSDFVLDFINTLRDERRAEEELAFQKQKRIAEATSRLDSTWMDGLGECHLRVDTTAYWHWVMREGREIWNDKSFLKAYKRDNPEVVVKAKSRKIMVGYR